MPFPKTNLELFHVDYKMPFPKPQTNSDWPQRRESISFLMSTGSTEEWCISSSNNSQQYNGIDSASHNCYHSQFNNHRIREQHFKFEPCSFTVNLR